VGDYMDMLVVLTVYLVIVAGMFGGLYYVVP
jgi:hypothetical protein